MPTNPYNWNQQEEEGPPKPQKDKVALAPSAPDTKVWYDDIIDDITLRPYRAALTWEGATGALQDEQFWTDIKDNTANALKSSFSTAVGTFGDVEFLGRAVADYITDDDTWKENQKLWTSDRVANMIGVDADHPTWFWGGMLSPDVLGKVGSALKMGVKGFKASSKTILGIAAPKGAHIPEAAVKKYKFKDPKTGVEMARSAWDEADAMLKEGASSQDIWRKTRVRVDQSGIASWHIDDMGAQFNTDVPFKPTTLPDGISTGYVTTLGDLLDHPDMYEALDPLLRSELKLTKGASLGKLPVYFNLHNPTSAAYNVFRGIEIGLDDAGAAWFKKMLRDVDTDNPFTLDIETFSDEAVDTLGTLLHETQHIVQSFGKMPIGGDPEVFVKVGRHLWDKVIGMKDLSTSVARFWGLQKTLEPLDQADISHIAKDFVDEEVFIEQATALGKAAGVDNLGSDVLDSLYAGVLEIDASEAMLEGTYTAIDILSEVRSLISKGVIKGEDLSWGSLRKGLVHLEKSLEQGGKYPANGRWVRHKQVEGAREYFDSLTGDYHNPGNYTKGGKELADFLTEFEDLYQVPLNSTYVKRISSSVLSSTRNRTEEGLYMGLYRAVHGEGQASAVQQALEGQLAMAKGILRTQKVATEGLSPPVLRSVAQEVLATMPKERRAALTAGWIADAVDKIDARDFTRHPNARMLDDRIAFIDDKISYMDAEEIKEYLTHPAIIAEAGESLLDIFGTLENAVKEELRIAYRGFDEIKKALKEIELGMSTDVELKRRLTRLMRLHVADVIFGDAAPKEIQKTLQESIRGRTDEFITEAVKKTKHQVRREDEELAELAEEIYSAPSVTYE